MLSTACVTLVVSNVIPPSPPLPKNKHGKTPQICMSDLQIHHYYTESMTISIQMVVSSSFDILRSRPTVKKGQITYCRAICVLFGHSVYTSLLTFVLINVKII